jgi:tetratricopeptide (TPR) repeat protein
MMPGTWFRWLALTTVIVCAAAGLEARAEAAGGDATAAREHYERGTKFYDIGKYEEAIREFEAAYEAKSDPAFIYNLAQSHRLAGHSTEALQLYRNYLRYVPKAPNRADIEERIRGLEKTIAERPGQGATPPPATPPTPTTGTAGPATVGTTPPPGPGENAPPPSGPPSWPPGPDANATPPYQPQLGYVPPPAPPPPPPVAPAVSPHRNAAIALSVAGGALVVTGAVFGLVAQSQAKKVETAAANGDKFDPSVESLGRNAVVLQWVGYGLGVAALATGLILFNSHAEASAPPQRVAASAMAGRGLAGAQVRVTF